MENEQKKKENEIIFYISIFLIGSMKYQLTAWCCSNPKLNWADWTVQFHPTRAGDIST